MSRAQLVGKMWISPILALGLCTVLLAQGKTRDKQFAEPSDELGTIYFLREGKFMGAAAKLFVFSGPRLLAVLPNESYSFAQIRPGRQLLWWGVKAPGFELEVEPGGLYYIDVTARIKRKDRLLDDEEALAMLDKIKSYSEPTDKWRKHADKLVKKHYAKVQSLPPEVSLGEFCATDGVVSGPIDKASPIALRPIALETDSEFPEATIDEWALELPRLIKKQMMKRGFRDVRIGEEGREADADVVLRGGFQLLTKGKAGKRFYSGSADAAVHMRIRFRLDLDAVSDPVVFDCARTGYGVPQVLFGALSLSPKRIMHNNIERIAASVAEFLAEGSKT